MSEFSQQIARLQQIRANQAAQEARAAAQGADGERNVERMVEWYEERCDQYGFSWAGVGWESEQMQELRFAVLAAALFNEGTLLDVGCGHGHFYDYLRKSGRGLDYEGVDISEKNLAIARAQFPEAEFRHADFLDLDLDQAYDFVIASGTFNIRVSDSGDVQRDYLFAAIDRMYRAARKGIAFNLVSVHAPDSVKEYPALALYDPVLILEHCMKLSYYTELKHTYLPHDFTVYVYRRPDFDALHEEA